MRVTAEPAFTVARFNQAALRLEVLRGVKRSNDALLLRMLRRYRAVNVIDPLEGLATRFVDLEKSCVVAS